MRDLEIARKERLDKAGRLRALLKLDQQEKETTKEMSRKWSMLPPTDRKRITEEEERHKRLEIKEAKENIWKRWRRKEKPDKRLETEQGRADVKEIKLKRIEEALKRINEEKELEKVSQERERERRRKYIEENKVKENDRIIREKQKTEKIQKKKKLELKWEMVRWLTRFLEDKKCDQGEKIRG